MNDADRERLYREAMSARRAGDVCPLCRRHHSALSSCELPQDRRPAEPIVPTTAASMNRVGSPTGRVERDASDTSVTAAKRVNAKSQRAVILALLGDVGEHGLTGIEIGRLMADPPLVSSRTLPRLGELWEESLVVVVRERGRCVLGECHEHDKPRAVHKPCSRCEIHGKPLTRDGASVWVADRMPDDE